MKAIKFLTFEFFPKVVMEFVWLLFSVSFGMMIVFEATQISDLELDRIVTQYGSWIVMVLFNGAALRIVLHFGLNWLDKRLDQQAAESRETMDQAKTGIRYAIKMLLHQPITTDEPSADDKPVQ